MVDERLHRRIGVLTRGNPHRHACPRRRDELVGRLGDLRRVDPEDGYRRLHPHAIGDAALADEPRARPHADLLAELFFGEVERIGLAVREPGDRDVAFVVVQRREGLREHRQRVGDRTAEFARVHRVVERSDLDVARDDPAQRHRESRLPGAPIARVREDHGVGAELIAVALEELREIRRAPFLFALDEHRDTDRSLAIERAKRARVHDDTALVIG